jgi:hypothetical protein
MRNPFVRQKGPQQPCRSCLKAFEQLRTDWLEYEATLVSYMERMNAWAARQAKRDKRLLAETLDAQVPNGQETTPAEIGAADTLAAARAALAGSILARTHPAAAARFGIPSGGLAPPRNDGD